jgi:tetratricopeptide (TPR) repeat protein
LSSKNKELVAANSEITRVNSDLAAEKARVQERFDLAMEAIGKFHTGVSGDVLLKQSEFKELRGRLLRDARQYYDKLLDLLKDQPDAQSRRALGKAYYDLGGLLSAIGTYEEALDAHRRALDVRRELAERPGAGDATIVDYGKSLMWTAESLKAMGRYNQARTCLEEGLRFAETAPNSRAHRAVRSMMDTTIGQHEMFTDKWSEALDRFQRSLAFIEEDLARPQPIEPIAELKRVKSVHLSAIADYYGRVGHPEEALARKLEALELIKELYEKEPDNTELHRGLVDAWSGVASAYSGLGGDHSKEAMAAFLEAQRLLKTWAETEPANRDLQRLMADHQAQMAGSHFGLGHWEQALASYEEVIRLSGAVAHADPYNNYAQSQLAVFLCYYGNLLEEMGRPGEALPKYEESRKVIERVLRQVDMDHPYWEGCRAWNARVIGRFHRRRDADRHTGRGLDLGRSGHPAEAVKEYRQAIGVLEGLEDNKLILDHYHLACHHARLAELAGAADSGLSAAEGPAEQDRALECLRAAVAAGFRDLARIRADSDLDALRCRADFQLLMLDLAMPDDPFAR